MTFEIFMPFYGRFDHFKEAVESILAQDDPDWKLTVVDDVYPDMQPGKWLEDIKDNRITYIRNSKNLRPSKNYNKCSNLCESKFIMLMGCDDMMLPNFVSTAKQLISQFPETDIIQPGVNVINDKSKKSRPFGDQIKTLIRPKASGARIYGGEKLACSLIIGNWTYFPSLIWRTGTIKELVFRTDFDVVQDLEMLLRIIMSGGTMVVDNKTVFLYRRHSMSVSSVTGPDGTKFIQERALFNEISDSAQKIGWKKASRLARQHFLSRGNALRELPGALMKKNKEGISNLTRHVLGLNFKRN